MIILGIDPGFAITGYGVLDYERGKYKVLDYGAILTSKELSLPERLTKLQDGLTQVIEKYKPTDVAIEELFFSKNLKTGILVAEARGVILVKSYELCEGLFEYTPMQIKLAVTGYGGAEKQQVQAMVKMLLGLPKIPKPDDVADALAVAIAHANSISFKEQYRIK